jgi:short-subunit dehydrogenase
VLKVDLKETNVRVAGVYQGGVNTKMFEKTGEDNLDGTGEWTFTHNPFSK